MHTLGQGLPLPKKKKGKKGKKGGGGGGAADAAMSPQMEAAVASFRAVHSGGRACVRAHARVCACVA